jgi:hypothetical protein
MNSIMLENCSKQRKLLRTLVQWFHSVFTVLCEQQLIGKVVILCTARDYLILWDFLLAEFRILERCAVIDFP